MCQENRWKQYGRQRRERLEIQRSERARRRSAMSVGALRKRWHLLWRQGARAIVSRSLTAYPCVFLQPTSTDDLAPARLRTVGERRTVLASLQPAIVTALQTGEANREVILAH